MGSRIANFCKDCSDCIDELTAELERVKFERDQARIERDQYKKQLERFGLGEVSTFICDQAGSTSITTKINKSSKLVKYLIVYCCKINLLSYQCTSTVIRIERLWARNFYKLKFSGKFNLQKTFNKCIREFLSKSHSTRR